IPPFAAELVHPDLDRFARGYMSSQNRRKRNMGFESRAASVFHRQIARQALADLAAEIHHSYGFDDIKHRAAHRAGIHAQCAADAARYPFEEFEIGEIMMPGLDCDIFETGARAAFQTFAFNLDARERWMR